MQQLIIIPLHSDVLEKERLKRPLHPHNGINQGASGVGCGVLEHARGRTLFRDATRLHHVHARAQLAHEGQVVADKKALIKE